MARLDDITTLPTNLELSGNDSLVIADKSFNGGSFAKQVPAAIICSYNHGYLLNFDSASVNVASQVADINLRSFTGGKQIIDKAQVIVTKPFVGLGSTPKIHLGVFDMDNSGAVDNLVDSVVINAIGGGIFNDTNDEDSSAEGIVVCPDGDTLRAQFDANSGNLSAATAGQVVILVNIIDVDDFALAIPAFD